jgi:predicted nucleic acid-binding protein
MSLPEEASYDCVVDASVAIRLFVVEPLSDRADSLFSHLADDPPSRLYVPDLFFIECTNVLWKYVSRFGYDGEAARHDVADLSGLPLGVVSTSVLAEAALELSLEYGGTARDSAYVALAERLSLPLVTADEELVKRFDNSAIDVRSLGVWPS